MNSQEMNFGDRAMAGLIARPSIGQKVALGGRFHARCYDKDWNLKWEEWADNLVVAEGLNHILNTVFKATSQADPWYVAIFDATHTVDSGDTYATPGFTECTSYTETSRPEWLEGSVSGLALTNTNSKAQFTFAGSLEIFGAALVGGGTNPSSKGDSTAGSTLFAAGEFGTSRTVANNDVLEVTYQISANDDGA